MTFNHLDRISWDPDVFFHAPTTFQNSVVLCTQCPPEVLIKSVCSFGKLLPRTPPVHGLCDPTFGSVYLLGKNIVWPPWVTWTTHCLTTGKSEWPLELLLYIFPGKTCQSPAQSLVPCFCMSVCVRVCQAVFVCVPVRLLSCSCLSPLV